MCGCFSEGPRSQGAGRSWPPQTHSLGGENDAPSRNISRFLDSLADRLQLGLDVRQIWRTDRFGRGGDHIPFLELGYPAARLTVAVENYNWQHQDLRTENGIRYGDTIDHVDFPYLAKMTKLNVAALAAIASAPPPPEPKVEGAVSTDTTVTWDAGSGRGRLTVVRGGGPTRTNGSVERRTDGNALRSASDTAPCGHAAVNECKVVLPAHPRRRLGVRRLVGEQGRVRKPGRLGGAGRRVPSLYCSSEEALTHLERAVSDRSVSREE